MVTQQHRVGLFATFKAMAARTKRGIFVLLFCVIATDAYAGSAPVNITLTITPNPIVSGKPTKFTVSVTAQSGSGTPTGTVDIFAAGQQCTITLPGTNCSLTVSGSGSITVTAVYNGDANFAGNGISKTTPVVSQTNVFLDQFGLTGTWYNAATSGQGFVLVSYPDLAGAGTGVIAGGWFTLGQWRGMKRGGDQVVAVDEALIVRHHRCDFSKGLHVASGNFRVCELGPEVFNARFQGIGFCEIWHL